ncbi:hypothetical protein [Peribacillus frigoritolerans]|uniref:hypothetical protein n=1 Tax=Peribacillus frigoritolerans TaxID=450367 RepID=UPI00301AF9BA
MKKLKKRVFLGLGVLMAAFILFLVYDYLDNQKREEQSRTLIVLLSGLTPSAIIAYSLITLLLSSMNARADRRRTTE